MNSECFLEKMSGEDDGSRENDADRLRLETI